MPLERRQVRRMKVLAEDEEGDDESEEANKIAPLFDEDGVSKSASEGDINSTHSSVPVADLESFRDKWLAELGSKSGKSSKSKAKNTAVKPNDLTEEAKYEKASKLFLEGADLERTGDMCEAVQRYMAAVRLVPDIEFRIFKNRNAAQNSKNLDSDSRNRSSSRPRSDKSAEKDDDLSGTLKNRIASRGTLLEAANPEGNECSICTLPAEILSTIVRYVVGSALDVRCLEMLSMTSSGFYVLARNEELWRTICRRVYGEHRLNAIIEKGEFTDWRQLYITRPHVYLHGVYICKCTYIRHGEASFQDQFYRPWHIVVYYRHMRFFADGTAMMVTSSEPLAQVVPQLKSRSTRLNGVLFGRYWLVGHDRLAVQFHRKCERSEQKPRRYWLRHKENFVPHELADQEFNIELRFGDGKRRSVHCVLHWEKYDCAYTYLSGEVSRSSIDVTDHQKFPPLYFSRVKCFAQPDGWDEILT